jgi:hypothetical protein
VTRVLLCCACLLTLLTPTCTQDPLTDNMRPSREIPLPHPADKSNPQEGHQPSDITGKRRDDIVETPRDGTDTHAAKSHRAKKKPLNETILRNANPQEGEGLKLSQQCKSIKHKEHGPHKIGQIETRTNAGERCHQHGGARRARRSPYSPSSHQNFALHSPTIENKGST